MKIHSITVEEECPITVGLTVRTIEYGVCKVTGLGVVPANNNDGLEVRIEVEAPGYRRITDSHPVLDMEGIEW